LAERTSRISSPVTRINTDSFTFIKHKYPQKYPLSNVGTHKIREERIV